MGGSAPQHPPDTPVCPSLSWALSHTCSAGVRQGSTSARAGSSPVLLARLQLAALQKLTAWRFNQLFALCFGVEAVKVWSTELLGRAQGSEEEVRVPGESLACSIPRPTSRRSHLGQALAWGCPVTLNHKGLVQVWWFLGGFAGEAWAMPSGTVADQSGILRVLH